jgi:hypothetical protein
VSRADDLGAACFRAHGGGDPVRRACTDTCTACFLEEQRSAAQRALAWPPRYCVVLHLKKKRSLSMFEKDQPSRDASSLMV